MANQWGRDSQGRVAGGSNPAGTVIAAVVCFLLGAGGGYGYFTLTRSDLKAEVDLLSAQIVETSAERDKLAADIQVYRKNSGSWAQDLETELADLKLNELPKLTRLLDKRDQQLSAQKTELVSAQAALKAAEDATANTLEITRRDHAAELAAIEKRSQDALSALRSDTAGTETTLRRQIEEAKTETASLRARLEQAIKSSTGNEDDIQQTQQRLAAEAERAVGLERVIDGLETEIGALKVALEQANADEPSASVSQSTATELPTPANSVRDRASVETALGETVGLQGLAEDDRAILTEKLIAGECVVQSLDIVFDRVPVIVLRNLMRDLKSDC